MNFKIKGFGLVFSVKNFQFIFPLHLIKVSRVTYIEFNLNLSKY